MGITSQAPRAKQQGTLAKPKPVVLRDPPPIHLRSPTPGTSPVRAPAYLPTHLHPRYKATEDQATTNQSMSQQNASEKKPSRAPLGRLISFIWNLNSAPTSSTATKTKPKEGSDNTLRDVSNYTMNSPALVATPIWKHASADAPRRPAPYSGENQPANSNGIEHRANRERSPSPRPFGDLRNRASQIFGRGSVPDSSIPVVLPDRLQQKLPQAWIEYPDGTKLDYSLEFILANHVS